ncbi:PHB depolymerase family esterase [Alteromonas sp. a30]|nr:PHB depolymerase family esterase [Alteromonas sp. a30]
MKLAKVSLLCGLALAGQNAIAADWQRGLAVGGFNKVNLYVPDTTSDIGNGKALMIVLHGCTQSIDAYLTANLEAAADKHGMVIAVPDAVNKAGFSCWSYWQGTKSRSAGDYKNLISLANALKSDSSYGIDSDQVYIAGLSSGAAFANTTACLAPDVFAGMGVSAGPSIGTSSSGALGPCEQADVRSRCVSYAGSYANHFDTQIASIAQGDRDTTVNLCYNDQNSQGMAAVYGVDRLAGTNTISDGSRSAVETLWEDGRVSKLVLTNADHAWSGGAGASGSYISSASINYADYLGQYFKENNNRVDRNQGPQLSNINVSTNSDVIVLTGNAQDAEGSVVAVNAIFDDRNGTTNAKSGTVDASGNFTIYSDALPDGLYFVTVGATDNEGKDSEFIVESVYVGPPPPDTAPTISDVSVAVNQQCATVSGSVADINQNLSSVVVQFANGNVNAQMNQSSFSAEACNLPGGNNSATVVATDSTNLSSQDSVSFNIDAGQVATLDQHITAGRLSYVEYSTCYLEYGTAAFKLNEEPTGQGQCVWQDNDASCRGPAVACSSGGSTGGGSGGDTGGGDTGGGTSPNCEEVTTLNYYHKVAGRAYSEGNALAPDYFANGSNDSMPGSTYGNNTLHSDDGSTWYLGSCQ